ncbi:MAG: hypothetical protein HYS39_00095 [Proteobacteria bacterium]|nr:hypothetical protein [Pseudomonadota bacterium]
MKKLWKKNFLLPIISLCIIAFMNLEPSAAHAKGTLNKQIVDDFLVQMSAVISARDMENMRRFFTFYADPSAKFTKQSSLYTHSGKTLSGTGNIELTRDKYIEYLFRITSRPLQYGYEAKLKQLTILEGGTTAVVLVEVREVAIFRMKNRPKAKAVSNNAIPQISQEKTDKILNVGMQISSNCNISFNYSDTLIITGSSCAENISIQ